MNNTGRKQIQKVVEKLKELSEIVEGLRDEEQDTLDNMTESLEDSDRY